MKEKKVLNYMVKMLEGQVKLYKRRIIEQPHKLEYWTIRLTEASKIRNQIRLNLMEYGK